MKFCLLRALIFFCGWSLSCSKIEYKSSKTVEIRVLVIGAAGFLGYHFCDTLVTDNGITITAIDNFNIQYDHNLKHARAERLKTQRNLSVLHGDICDTSFIQEFLNSKTFTHVISLVSKNDPPFFSVNTTQLSYGQCFLNLLEHLLNPNQFPLILYTTDIHSPAGAILLGVPNMESIMQSLFDSKNLVSIGIRLPLVYGPWGRPFIESNDMFNDRTLIISDLKHQFLYIEDTVRSILLLLYDHKPKKNEVYNIVGQFNLTYHGFMSLIAEHMKIIPKIKKITVKAKVSKGAHYPSLQVSNQTKLKNGIKKFVRWFREYKSQSVPCESECVRHSLCFGTGWQGAMIQSKRLSFGCPYVVYTVAMGENVDSIHGIKNFNSTFAQNCNFAFISKYSKLAGKLKKKTLNTLNPVYGNWTVVLIDEVTEFPDPRKASRLPKLSPGKFFSDLVKYAIYVDSKLVLEKSPEDILTMFREGVVPNSTVLMAVRHSVRADLFREIQKIIYYSKRGRSTITYQPEKLQNQMRVYKQYEERENVPYVHVLDGGVLIHDLGSSSFNQEAGENIRCSWFLEYLAGSDRDQIAITHVLGMKIMEMQGKHGFVGNITSPLVEFLPIYHHGKGGSRSEFAFVRLLSGVKYHWYKGRHEIVRKKRLKWN